MIYFYADFEPGFVSGGVRAIYRHASWLVEAGLPAAVIAPAGRPGWFASAVPVVDGAGLAVGPDDLVVLPEAVARNDLSDRLAAAPGRKLVFCQNHLYAFLGREVITELRDRLAGVYTCSAGSARVLESTFGLAGVPVVPPSVDPALFRPAPKALAVAVMPRKQPLAAAYIAGAVRARAPDLAALPWLVIDGRTEAEAAAALGQAAVFLSLSHEESFGLPPVEAMAAGCVVVGFHGGGGREYATAANGLWFDADDVDACADGLIRVLRALRDGSSRGWLGSLAAGGQETAARYTPAAERIRLLAVFGLS